MEEIIIFFLLCDFAVLAQFAIIRASTASSCNPLG
jgi:hypothetical protein